MREACLIGPFTVGFRTARCVEPKPGENAIVFGAGTIGIAAAIRLKYFGCKEVMICDHSDFQLDKATHLGFVTCNNSREDLKKAAMAVFGTAPSRFGPTANVSTYIDASGTKPILELYQSMGKIESRMVVVAVHAGKRPVDILEMTYSQHALIGSGGYNLENVEDVLAVMVQSRGICSGGCRSAKERKLLTRRAKSDDLGGREFPPGFVTLPKCVLLGKRRLVMSFASLLFTA